MSKIRRLPPSLIRRIAAGEVVERPSSVVKELVENSLDAASSSITVRVEDGGRTLIEVSDNGFGMTEEDALIAVERHTTSKISSEEDLERIETLGFRGEALYAISSVSVFTLVSKVAGEELATRIRVEGGVFKGLDKVYRPEIGTTVRVERLFFNLRARRRFLRSKNIEQEHIRRVIKEYALAFNQVSFRYWEEDRLLYSFDPEEIESRLVNVLDGDLLGKSVEDALSLYLVDTSRSDFFLFVNRRAVSDRSLMLLVRGLLKQRFVGRDLPSVVLFLNLDPREVDVNVHPTKREVRFKNRASVHARVESALLKALSGKRESAAAYSYISSSLSLSEGTPAYGADQKSFPIFEGEEGETGRYRYLGEFASLYMIFEDALEGALVIVDKHALHERVIFDSLVKGRPDTLPVFIPLDFDVSDWKDYLTMLGFELDEEGKILLSVPKWAYGKEAAVIRRMMEEEVPVNPTYEELARVACRAAVKAGDRSYLPDALRVSRILEEKGEGLTCPHGRPVVVKLKRSDLDALFKRRM